MSTVEVINDVPLIVELQMTPPMTVELSYPGVQGPKGSGGIPGMSAYQIAVIQGFVGTEEQWLLSLHATGGTRVVKTISANTTIVVTDQFVRATAPCTATLPIAQEAFQCTFKNVSSGYLTLSAQGSDLIEGQASIILTPGQSRGLSGFNGGFDVW